MLLPLAAASGGARVGLALLLTRVALVRCRVAVLILALVGLVGLRVSLVRLLLLELLQLGAYKVAVVAGVLVVRVERKGRFVGGDRLLVVLHGLPSGLGLCRLSLSVQAVAEVVVGALLQPDVWCSERAAVV